ncbi:MAG: YcjF family protein, partial [Coriobacteriia bacterium]|nr:YcjF family protein [Coriobacteriia bacterium]
RGGIVTTAGTLGTGVKQRGGLLGTALAAPRYLRSLPVQPLNVLKQARSYLGLRNEELKIGIFIDPRISDGCLDSVVEQFKPNSTKSRVLVHVLSDSMVLGDQISYSALVFVLHRPDSAATMISQSKDLGLPTLVVVEEGLRREAAEAYDISILDVASARNTDSMIAQISGWFADALSEHRMSLATDFNFMRPALSQSVINATARQNAIIAAVFFMPGADLPAMTLNQIKMVLQLAFIYGEELTLKRLVEAAVVVFSAYTSRAAARSATRGLMRPLRWPVKIAVAYASTLALGKGMEAWLHQAPSIPALDKSIPKLLEKTPLAKLLPAAADEGSAPSADGAATNYS